MSLLIESICFLDGKPLNMGLHQKRVEQAQHFFFNKISIPDLENQITNSPKIITTGRVKCRVIYDTQIKKIEFIKYQLPKIKTLALIKTNDLKYAYKLADRQELEKLYIQKKQCDDIIIVNNNQISDSYFCNLVFEDKNKKLFTPTQCLLAGIKREMYLQENKITKKDIAPQELNTFSKIYLINAMINLYEIEINNIL